MFSMTSGIVCANLRGTFYDTCISQTANVHRKSLNFKSEIAQVLLYFDEPTGHPKYK